jgi:hypothetical protein
MYLYENRDVRNHQDENKSKKKKQRDCVLGEIISTEH